MDVAVTLVGGPTVLLEINGVRLLTDPTFDPPGEYQLPHVTLRKTAPPSMSIDDLGRIDAVLLSHDQHADNLDVTGRAFLGTACVFTTRAGAGRLGGGARGLDPWEQVSIGAGDQRLLITATPARHGPAGIEPLAGDVIGFMLSTDRRDLVYVTGDTVWYDGIAKVANRCSPRL